MLPKFWTARATSLWGGRGGIDADVDIDVNGDDGPAEKSSLLSSVVFSILIFLLFSCAVDNAKVDGMFTIIRYLFIVTVRSGAFKSYFILNISLSLFFLFKTWSFSKSRIYLITRSGKDQINQHTPRDTVQTPQSTHTNKCVTETRMIVD